MKQAINQLGLCNIKTRHKKINYVDSCSTMRWPNIAMNDRHWDTRYPMCEMQHNRSQTTHWEINEHNAEDKYCTNKNSNGNPMLSSKNKYKADRKQIWMQVL